MEQPTAEERQQIERTFVRNLCVAVAVFSVLPNLAALAFAPPGASYLGYQFATDDQMVYAAWMRQAMEGRFLFDNRFTTDSQPGLTLHLYFLVLGWIAKFLGIAATSIVTRMTFSVIFVLQLYRLVRRIDWTVHATKLSLLFAIFGGGFGFLLWHDFGVAIVKPVPEFLNMLLLGRLPTDIWQPEGFVFSSMLTNSLFMVSLCLILFLFNCFLDSESSWRPVLPGALAFGLLMNIHSYDVLLVGLVLFGFLVMEWARDRATREWISRAFIIGLGAVPFALWFLYVYRNDPVFQARAATETFSPNFRQVLVGYLMLIAISIPTLFASRDHKKRPYYATLIYVLALVVLAIMAQGHSEGYFLTMMQWAFLYGATVFLLYSVAHTNPARNLMVAWALVGVVAIYFPALFQRKLGMGLAIPWAVLAAGGVAIVLAKQERSARNMATVLLVIVVGATGLRWLFREVALAQQNVANTVVHPVFLSPDATRIIRELDSTPGKKIVVAPPGIMANVLDEETGQPIPDQFRSPIMPDLNAIASGLSGSYTYAGHWSETPNYNSKRAELEKYVYYGGAPLDVTANWLKEHGITHVIAPEPEAFPGLPITDLKPMGEVTYSGAQFSLVKLNL
jgi:arabinosyltransferase C